MLLFAHLGLTLAAARLAGRWNPAWNPALAFVALGSLLPDIIDKPLGWIIYGTPGMGRIYAHTLLFVLLLAALAAVTGSRGLWSLTGGAAAHLCLDGMWNSPIVLLWPLMGDFPLHTELSVVGYLEMLLSGLWNPSIVLPEAAGFFYLLYSVPRMIPGVPSMTLHTLKDKIMR